MEESKQFSINGVKLFSNWIVINNPILGKLDKGKFEKMPKQMQLQTLSNAASEFYDVEVIAVGCDCTKLKKGDHAFLTNEIAAAGILIDNNKYILIRENNILGEYVGTKENL